MGFSSTPEPLGAIVDLQDARKGVCRITNKPKRIEELCRTIEEIVDTNACDRDRLRSLRGRLIFTRAQTFGKVGGIAMRALNRAAEQTSHGKELDAEVVEALWVFRSFLQDAPPREIRCQHLQPPLFFTDGSCEPQGGDICAAIGAVLLDPLDGAMLWFGAELPHKPVRTWAGEKGTQVISQAELLPVALARCVWRDRFRGRSAIVFIDNESSRAGLVRAYSPHEHNARMVSLVTTLDILDGALSWYERVPSASNPADPPSRGKPPPDLVSCGPAVRTEVTDADCVLAARVDQSWGEAPAGQTTT